MISVVIPLYNKEKQIKKTLETVLSQTFQDFEIVIVNDGSTDGSVDEVLKFKDKRIHLFHQANAGVSAARNRGIKEAKGEYIAFLDADDEWMPDYLQTQAQNIKEFSQCAVLCCNYMFKDSTGEIQNTIIKKIPFKNNTNILTNYFEVASCSNPPICSISIVVHKDAIKEIGGFPLGVKSGEDLLTWAKLAVKYDIAYCREPKAIFNIEGYNVKDKPKRIPADKDIVGSELEKLYQENKEIKGLRKYVGHWHKMRSSIYLRLDMRSKSIKEAMKAIYYNPINYKLYAYIVLNLLPKKLRPF